MLICQYRSIFLGYTIGLLPVAVVSYAFHPIPVGTEHCANSFEKLCQNINVA
jgi:hypothetical protein